MRLRQRLYARFSPDKAQLVNVLKWAEPVLILFITVTASILVPAVFGCTKYECVVPEAEVSGNIQMCNNLWKTLRIFVHF